MNSIHLLTRTHWVARHPKSPRSQRKLMVFDHFALAQRSPVYPKGMFFIVFWSTNHQIYFDMPHDHFQKIQVLTRSITLEACMTWATE